MEDDSVRGGGSKRREYAAIGGCIVGGGRGLRSCHNVDRRLRCKVPVKIVEDTEADDVKGEMLEVALKWREAWCRTRKCWCRMFRDVLCLPGNWKSFAI